MKVEMMVCGKKERERDIDPGDGEKAVKRKLAHSRGKCTT